MAVSKRLRYEILRRDNHACRYCGGTAPAVTLTIDHVVPVALGGSDDAGNLVAACRDCNSGKTSSSPDARHVEDVNQSALKWSFAMKVAAERRLESMQERDAYREDFKAVWDTWTYEYRGERRSFSLPTAWPLSIDSFVKAGLSTDEIGDCVQECMYRDGVSDRWRYFCGIAWARVRRLQDEATDVAEELEAGIAMQARQDGCGLGWPASDGSAYCAA